MNDEGHFLLAPLAAQEGDDIAVFLGCDSPMILRPGTDGRYQVIGEAYCLEWANGEALLGKVL